MHDFKIVKVDSKYCDYLREFDNKVPYNDVSKELRPFIGILFMVGEVEYFAPLSSPKEKHLRLKNTMDLIKLDSGKLGVINLNNMFPVKPFCYQLFNLNNDNVEFGERKRIILLKKQLRWINGHKSMVRGKAIRLYNMYIKGGLYENMINRCCNFKLLEEKCHLYHY